MGTRGDVQPFIALALALQKAGHQVKLCTHEAHRSLVENWKLNFCPLAGNPKDLIKLCVDNPNWLSVGFARDCANFFKFMDDLIASVWEATKEGDADVLIQNGAIFAGQHVAEKFKVEFLLY